MPATSLQAVQTIPERRLYSIKETCQITNMSAPTVWRRIGEFDARKIGRRTYITSESIERFLAQLPKAGRVA